MDNLLLLVVLLLPQEPPLLAICQLTPQLLGVNPWNPFTGAAAIREPIVTDTRALSPFVTIWPHSQIFWAQKCPIHV